MYFNIRKPPLRSQVLWNPVNFFFPRPTSNISESTRFSNPSSSPQQRFSLSDHTHSQDGSRPIPSIPPASNPRGEIIFSSRVDKSFREGYDRYRLAFEKKREEVVRQINEQKRMERRWWVYRLRFWAPPPSSSPRPSSDLAGADASTSPGYSRNSSQSSRGRGTPRSGTPPSTPGSSSSMSSPRKRGRSSSPMSSQGSLRSLGGGQRKNPLGRRVTPDDGGPNLDRGDGTGRLRELDEEGDMRMRAHERSWAQGLPGPNSTLIPWIIKNPSPMIIWGFL